MAKNELNIALIGQAFMGRAHSNAWSQVDKFFNAPLKPVLYGVSGQDTHKLECFAQNWGWRIFSTDWKNIVTSAEISLVDIATPNYLHAPIAIRAMESGKHVACEKPLAVSLHDAKQMLAAARATNTKTFVWFNYRRCPAVSFAYHLVKSGALGQIRHVRAKYLQDWADESVPFTWRFDKDLAGTGAHGDLNAHMIDMVRFILGQEVVEICGAIADTFIEYRDQFADSLHDANTVSSVAQSTRQKVSVDDTVLFLARFSGGAVGSFEAARQATGNKNRNSFEINGTKGAIRFDFERMNELEYFDATTNIAVQGWNTIMCTHKGSHPYIEAWWPDAHLIGYEHTFVNMAYDILRVLSGDAPLIPLPDFKDAYQTQLVLEAAIISAREKRNISIAELQ